MLQPSANASAIRMLQLYTRMLQLYPDASAIPGCFSCIPACLHPRNISIFPKCLHQPSAKCVQNVSSIRGCLLQLSPNASAEPSVNDSVVSCSFQLLLRSSLCLRCQTFPLPHLILFYSGLPYLSASPAAALLPPPPPPPSAACVCSSPSNHARKLFSGANLRRHAE